jgi:hypothetical protein
MDVELSFSAPPTLNQEVTLVFRVKPLIDAPDTTVQIDLPEGFLSMGGPLEWREDIFAEESRVFQVQVKAIKTGTWTITAKATSRLPDGAVFGKPATLSVDVKDSSGIIRDPESSVKDSETKSTAVKSDKLSVPMDMDLSVSASPALDEVVVLTFRVKPLIDAPRMAVRVDLPEGIQAVEGQLEWQEDVLADEVREYQVRIKTVKTGLWTITAEATSHLAGGAKFGKSMSLYVDVTDSGAAVSDRAKER